MKRTILFLLLTAITYSVQAQDVRVLSDAAIGKGWYPRISSNGQEVTFLGNEHESWREYEQGDMYVTNEDLQLVLYNGSSRTVLTPHGADVHYIWSSLSPDKTRILFNTKRGTAICDLEGRELVNLGELDAPKWFGNDYVVGMFDPHDGHYILSSSIFLCSADGTYRKCLTDGERFAMYPSVSRHTGRIAYNTLGGELRMLQLNMSDEPISDKQPVCRQVQGKARKAPRKLSSPQELSSLKIYINPGHGGHGSNDRNIVIYPFVQGDPEGFWESNSNLDKGLMLDTMLRDLGVVTKMSRKTNNDGGGNDSDVLKAWLNAGVITQEEYQAKLANGDDRSLSAIVAEANAWGADYMLSIHSNAGVNNYVLELYSGKDLSDGATYGTRTYHDQEGYDLCTILAKYLYANKITTWGSNYTVRGDKTFAKQIFNWSDGYGVLRGLQMPGCISEGCMHDYLPETYRLMNMDYKKQEAWNFTRTFLAYYCDMQLTTGVIGGQVRDAYQKQQFPNIYHIRNSRDELEPICGATVELMQNDNVLQTYTTDAMYNGVFFFWDLTPGTYQVRVTTDKYYPMTYDIEVEANEISYQDFMLNLRRATPPEIVSYSPAPQTGDSVEVAESIVLNFNWDMWTAPTAAAFSIEPEVEGVITFENSNKTMRFTPTSTFAPGTTYTVTLSTEACHPDTFYSNHLQEPFMLTFVTRNRPNLVLKQFYPADGATDLSLTPTFKLLFDAEIDEDIKPTLFKVTGPNGFTFSPNMRNVMYNDVTQPYGSVTFAIPAGSELQPNTQYTLQIDAAVTDAAGVALGTQRTITFTTGTGYQKQGGELLIPCDLTEWTYNAEKSTAVSSQMIIIDRSIKTEGTCSNMVEYAFDDDDEAALFLSPTDLSQVFTSIDALTLDLFGDLSYNEVYAEFATEGDVHQVLLATMDYAGWKSIRLELSALPEAVQYQFAGLKVVRTDNILSRQGTFYIDNLCRIAGSTDAIESVVESEKQRVEKVMRDGEVIIRNGEDVYTTIGQKRQ